jgi:hypothetical protein
MRHSQSLSFQLTDEFDLSQRIVVPNCCPGQACSRLLRERQNPTTPQGWYYAVAQSGTALLFVFNPPDGGTTFVSGGIGLISTTACRGKNSNVVSFTINPLSRLSASM